ncbi:MAG: Uma2 family endonuclease [Alphaproteobacteria bacterium]|nr:Uma2 family endonuclease [Alphaproteobacteria bacterium]
MSAGAALRRKEPTRRATYRDVLDAPPHMVAEIVDGALHLQPRPAIRHTVASSFLGGELFGPFQRGRGGPGGWWILDEPELHLGKDVLVPDLAGWRRERLREPPDEAFFTLEPDWVCEVLSPSTRKLDLEEKRPVYAREGVGHLWLVDPSARTLEAFVLSAAAWSPTGLARNGEPVSFPPFEAIAFPLDALWP